MSTVAERALKEAKKKRLDLEVHLDLVPTSIFALKKVEPRLSVYQAMRDAASRGESWVQGMPYPVLTWHKTSGKYRIMDGMMRLVAAQMAGIPVIPALIASGETYDALEPILRNGYYGEDFIEMLAMVSPDIRKNLDLRDENRLSGK